MITEWQFDRFSSLLDVAYGTPSNGDVYVYTSGNLAPIARNGANGYAGLNASGKIETSLLADAFALDSDFDTHVADQAPHGATAANTNSKIVARDSSGNIFGTTFVANDGTSANPAHTFANDTDCGRYRVGTNTYADMAATVELIRYTTSGIVINENSAAINTRIESDGNANMVLVDGTNNRLIIGAASGGAFVTLNDPNGQTQLRIERTGQPNNLQAILAIDTPGGSQRLNFDVTVNGSTVRPLMLQPSGGVVGVGTTTPPSVEFGVNGRIQVRSYTVAGLPSAGNVGAIAYASNGRKSGEGGGAGTGVPVWDNGSNWLTFYGNATVAA